MCQNLESSLNRFNSKLILHFNITSGNFDRELCSKVLKEALLLLFLVTWNHEQKRFQMEQKSFANKNSPNGTKNVQGNKKRSYKSK